MASPPEPTRARTAAVAASAGGPGAPESDSAEQREPSLSDEIALVDRARALARRAPAEALALLDEHARAFPNGVLRDHAAVARVEALLAADRRKDAEDYAAPFVRERAGTPVGRRIAALLESSEPRP